MLAPAGRRPGVEKRRTGDIRGRGRGERRRGGAEEGNRVKSTGVEGGGEGGTERSGWVTAHYVISTGS